MAKLIIPTPLRKFTENHGSLDTRGNTVKEAISELTATYPDLKKHLLDDEGRIRQFVRIYVGEDDIKSLEQENTNVGGDTIISIIPAIAGGYE